MSSENLKEGACMARDGDKRSRLVGWGVLGVMIALAGAGGYLLGKRQAALVVQIQIPSMNEFVEALNSGEKTTEAPRPETEAEMIDLVIQMTEAGLGRPLTAEEREIAIPFVREDLREMDEKRR